MRPDQMPRQPFPEETEVDRKLEQLRVLVEFEETFWAAVNAEKGSRDFDHDVCKPLRDFRALIDKKKSEL